MKRNILFALCALVLGVAGYVGYQRVSASSESDLFLANVEALSSGEGGYSESWDCWSNVKKGDGVWVCGNECFWDNEANGKGAPSSTCIAK